MNDSRGRYEMGQVAGRSKFINPIVPGCFIRPAAHVPASNGLQPQRAALDADLKYALPPPYQVPCKQAQGPQGSGQQTSPSRLAAAAKQAAYRPAAASRAAICDGSPAVVPSAACISAVMTASLKTAVWSGPRVSPTASASDSSLPV